MNLENQVSALLKWKKSAEWGAQRLNISVEEFKEIKRKILKEKKQIRKAEFQKRVENIKKVGAQLNTMLKKAYSNEQPKTIEDIERILNIDTSKWKVSSYWNKEKSNGKWLVSANITSKGKSDLSLTDVDLILDSVFNDKDFTPVTKYPTISNKKALFVYTSDKHIAAYVDKTSIYSNEYDEFTFEARMNLVLNEIYYQKSIYGKFEDIFIIDLGDKMDGFNGKTTRGGHGLPQSMDNKEAFETAIKVEKEFYDKVVTSEVANNVHVYQNTNNNHGGTFDYMVSRAIEIYLNAKYPQVETKILEKFIEHIVYGKHTILFTHGKDEMDMKHGLPLNLNDKTENYINKYLMYHSINPLTTTVSLIKGDLHRDSSETTYNFRYKNVLSLFGGSKWISTNFGPTKPGCSFDIIERDTSRIQEFKIMF